MLLEDADPYTKVEALAMVESRGWELLQLLGEGKTFRGGAGPDNPNVKHTPELETPAPFTPTKPRLVPPIAGLPRTQNQLLADAVDQDLRRCL